MAGQPRTRAKRAFNSPDRLKYAICPCGFEGSLYAVKCHQRRNGDHPQCDGMPDIRPVPEGGIPLTPRQQKVEDARAAAALYAAHEAAGGQVPLPPPLQPAYGGGAPAPTPAYPGGMPTPDWALEMAAQAAAQVAARQYEPDDAPLPALARADRMPPLPPGYLQEPQPLPITYRNITLSPKSVLYLQHWRDQWAFDGTESEFIDWCVILFNEITLGIEAVVRQRTEPVDLASVLAGVLSAA